VLVEKEEQYGYTYIY